MQCANVGGNEQFVAEDAKTNTTKYDITNEKSITDQPMHIWFTNRWILWVIATWSHLEGTCAWEQQPLLQEGDGLSLFGTALIFGNIWDRGASGQHIDWNFPHSIKPASTEADCQQADWILTQASIWQDCWASGQWVHCILHLVAEKLGLKAGYQWHSKKKSVARKVKMGQSSRKVIHWKIEIILKSQLLQLRWEMVHWLIEQKSTCENFQWGREVVYRPIEITC